MYVRRLKVFTSGFGAYACSSEDASGRTRPQAPKNLLGQPENFDQVCHDLMSPRNGYDSFVLSFQEPRALVGDRVIDHAVDEFERVLYAGLTKTDFTRCAVLHERQNGCDVHYGVGRTNRRTGQQTEFYNVSASDPELFSRFARAFSLRNGLSDPFAPGLVNLASSCPSSLHGEAREIWHHFDQAAAAYYLTGDAITRDELITAFRRDGIAAKPADKTSIVITHAGQRHQLRGAKYSVGFEYHAADTPRASAGTGEGGVPSAGGDPAGIGRIEAALARLKNERAERQQRNYDHAERSWRPITKGVRIRRRKRGAQPPARQCVRFPTWDTVQPGEPDRSAGGNRSAAMVGALLPSADGSVAPGKPGRTIDHEQRLGSVPASGAEWRPTLPLALAPDGWGDGDRSDIRSTGAVDLAAMVASRPGQIGPRQIARSGNREDAPKSYTSIVVPGSYHDDGAPMPRRQLVHATQGTGFVRRIYEKIYLTIRETRLRLGAILARAITVIAACGRELEQACGRIAEFNRAVAECGASVGSTPRRARSELSFAAIDRAGSAGNATLLHRYEAEGIDAGGRDSRNQQPAAPGALIRADIKRVALTLDRLRARVPARRKPAPLATVSSAKGRGVELV